METNKIPARADVPAKDKWAIQDLFATDDDWRAALAKAKEFIPRITAFRGRLAEIHRGGGGQLQELPRIGI